MATTIEMIEQTQAAIEGTVSQFVCETDSAYPHSPSVLWYLRETPVGIDDEHRIMNTMSDGENHGQKIDSTLRLIVKREMNMRKVKCMLKNDDKKWREHTLNVMCKYNALYAKRWI